jgi:hypothetical protein
MHKRLAGLQVCIRVSVNVPASIAAILFFVAQPGAISAIAIGVEACRDAALAFSPLLVSLSLTEEALSEIVMATGPLLKDQLVW